MDLYILHHEDKTESNSMVVTNLVRFCFILRCTMYDVVIGLVVHDFVVSVHQ